MKRQTLRAVGPRLYLRFLFAWLVRSFIARISEWGLALAMISLGLGLIWPGNTFEYSTGSWRMLTVMPERQWGMLMVAIGVVSVWGLWRNGAAPKTTSAVRLIGAAARSAIWLTYSVALFQASLQAGRFVLPFEAIAPIFMLMDWGVIVRATWEHRDAR